MQPASIDVVEPTPVQVVFQGGGARLALLMAVCEVLKSESSAEPPKQSRIHITRVAGSSAGAIAAIMLASKKSMSEYKTQLKSVSPRHLGKMRTNKWMGAARVLNGNHFFSKFDLSSFFLDLFSDEVRNKKLHQMPLSPRLYYTDLHSLSSRSAPDDEFVALALAKSCRFPLAFVGFGSDNTEVDGGLALNLPVDELKDSESTAGSVIGVGFSNRFDGHGRKDLLSYTQRLFSAAVQSSVSRSERIIGPENFYAIDTDIDTFDFDAALTRGLEGDYELVKLRFKTWLDEWLKKRQPDKSSTPGEPPSKRLIYPSLSDVRWPEAVVREINERQTDNPCTHAESLASYDTALFDEEGKFANRFKSRNSYEVQGPSLDGRLAV